MIIRAYLGAVQAESPEEQKYTLERFALKKGHRIREFYRETPTDTAQRPRLLDLLKQKGLTLSVEETQAGDRETHPELFKLLASSKPGDTALLPQLAVLEGLSDQEWSRLRNTIRERRLRLVTMDVEGSWKLLFLESGAFPMIDAITTTMLDTLETASRQPVRDHRQRQLAGIARAKTKGKFKGRPVDHEKHSAIQSMLDKGHSWTEICEETGVSRSTIARVVKKGT